MIFFKQLLFFIFFINISFLSYTDEGCLFIIEYLAYLKFINNAQGPIFGYLIGYLVCIILYMSLYKYWVVNSVKITSKLFLYSLMYIVFIVTIKNTLNYLIFLSILNLTFILLFFYFFIKWKEFYLIGSNLIKFMKKLFLLVLSIIIYKLLLEFYGHMIIPPSYENFIYLFNDTINYWQLFIMLIFSLFIYLVIALLIDILFYISKKIKFKLHP